MSKFIYIWLVLSIGIPAYGQTSATRVTGQILPGKAYPLQLWTYDIGKDKYELNQDLKLSKDGEFDFTIPRAPNLHKLWMDGKGLVFINDEDNEIVINIDMKNGSDPFRITGSEASNYYLRYLSTVDSLQRALLYPLEPEMKKAEKRKDELALKEVERKYQHNMSVFVSTLKQLIDQMGSSLAVFAIIRSLDFNKYLPQIESFYTTFQEDRPASVFTKKLGEMIDSAKRVQIGAQAPDFELVVSGKAAPQRLSELRGNHVLIDFWASWCLPCRKENRLIKEKYLDGELGQLKIWSISIDEHVDKWEKALIKDDLPWDNSWTRDEELISTYQVVGLPTNFLLDPSGRIIGKNLGSEELAGYIK